MRKLVLLLLLLMLSYGHANKLGIVPFVVVGDVPKQAGKELAAFVTGIVANKFIVKERLELPALEKERLFQQGDTIDLDAQGSLDQELGVDLLLLGQVSKTAGDYSLLIRICDMSGNIVFSTTVQAAAWETLREKLRFALHTKLPRPVTFAIVGKGDFTNMQIRLQGERKSYTVQKNGYLVPGRYKVKLDSPYQPETTWIEIKPGDEPQTIQIRVKGKNFDILLVIGYGGTLLGVLGVIMYILRLLSKIKPDKNKASSDNKDWEELIALGTNIRNKCRSLAEQENLRDFKEQLRQIGNKLDNLVGEIEIMPMKQREQRVYHLQKEIGKIGTELAVVQELAATANFDTIKCKLNAISELINTRWLY